MTVYVGAWDDLIELKTFLLSNYPEIPNAHAVAEETDIAIGDDRIYARFVPVTADHSNSYGHLGLPLGASFRTRSMPWSRNKPKKGDWENNRRAAHQKLCREYGAFYYGREFTALFETFIGMSIVPCENDECARLDFVREQVSSGADFDVV
jgi:hypothetical protein